MLGNGTFCPWAVPVGAAYVALEPRRDRFCKWCWSGDLRSSEEIGLLCYHNVWDDRKWTVYMAFCIVLLLYNMSCYLMLFVSVYDISFENFLRIPPPIVFCLSNALWVRRSPHQGCVARQQPESSRINSHTSSGLCHVNNSLETLAPAKTPRNCWGKRELSHNFPRVWLNTYHHLPRFELVR